MPGVTCALQFGVSWTRGSRVRVQGLVGVLFYIVVIRSGINRVLGYMYGFDVILFE